MKIDPIEKGLVGVIFVAVCAAISVGFMLKDMYYPKPPDPWIATTDKHTYFLQTELSDGTICVALRYKGQVTMTCKWIDQITDGVKP